MLLCFARRGADAMRVSPSAEWIVFWAGTLALLRRVIGVPQKDSDPRSAVGGTRSTRVKQRIQCFSTLSKSTATACFTTLH